MATTVQHQHVHAGRTGKAVSSAVSGDGRQPPGARLTAEQVWDALARASFAILGFVTPSGEPRSSGGVHKLIGRRLYVVTVTVTVRRGGLLSLVAPIPPATIDFHATAILHQAG
jgi:hypothetical protein